MQCCARGSYCYHTLLAATLGCLAYLSKLCSPVSGYFVRKFVFSYYAQKEYLKGLAVKNEVTRQELANYAQKMHEMQISAEEERRMEAFREEAEKKHYMLSTKTARGPYFPSHHKWVTDSCCTSCVLGCSNSARACMAHNSMRTCTNKHVNSFTPNRGHPSLHPYHSLVYSTPFFITTH